MVTQDETAECRLNSESPLQRRRSQYFGKKPRLLVNGEVVMSDFDKVKRNLILSFPNLHNTPRSLDPVNIPARIRGESIDTFKLSCGFLDFFFFWIFFLKGNWSLRTSPPPSSRVDFFSVSSIYHVNYT